MTFKLVKDFKEYQFVYFWINGSKKVVSPLLPTMEHAKEWYTNHHFSLYSGQERRQRKVDRRNKGSKGIEENAEIPFSRRIPSSMGRRASDLHIKVDIDLAEKKISQLKEAQ